MAFVFDPVVTNPTFNAYCTVQFAKDFQDSKLNTTFLTLPDATIERLIVFATRQIDTLEWKGIKTNIDQPHEFPRNYLWKDGGEHDTNALVLSSSLFDPTTIPNFIQEMCADICGTFAENDTTESSGLAEFSSIKVDTIEIKLKNFAATAWLQNSARNLAWRYLANSSAYSVRTQRVG